MSTPPTPEMPAWQQAVHSLYMQLLRTRQRVYALEAEAQLARDGKKPRFPVEFRSQFGEDIFVWDALGGQKEGFFIEVGAFDGYHYAVTYALEAVGWHGLLVEAIPERAEQCKARRPNSRVVNAALSRKGSKGTTTFTVADDHFGGMLSYLGDETSHAQRMSTSGIPMKSVSVPLTTMDDLLADHRGEIDVAVIDVEGAEVDLLNGFDLEKHRPRMVLLEDNSRGREPALGNYMSKKDYAHVGWIEVNRVYVRADCLDIRDRLMEVSRDL